MASPAPGLEVAKRTLSFTLGTAQDPVDVLSVRNTTDLPYYFKVKTTNPHRYIVRPNIGLVPPTTTLDITIALHTPSSHHHPDIATPTTPPPTTTPSPPPPATDPPTPGPSKDKFLLQSTPALSSRTIPATPSMDSTEDHSTMNHGSIIGGGAQNTLPKQQLSPADFWAAADAAPGSYPITAVKLRVNFLEPSDPIPAIAKQLNGGVVGTTTRAASAAKPLPSTLDAYGVTGTITTFPADRTSSTSAVAHNSSRHGPSSLEGSLLRTPGNAQQPPTKAPVETLQRNVDLRSRPTAAVKADPRDTHAEAKPTLADAKHAPRAANALATDPFGRLSIAVIAILILLFAVLVMIMF